MGDKIAKVYKRNYIMKALGIKFVEFNPNHKTKYDVSDCHVRALCSAEDLQWEEAYDIFSKTAKKLGYGHFGIYNVLNAVFKKFGYVDIGGQFPKNCIVAQVLDKYCNSNLIVGAYGHVVSYKQGVYYDIVVNGLGRYDSFLCEEMIAVWAKEDDDCFEIQKMVKKQKKQNKKSKKKKKGKKNG